MSAVPLGRFEVTPDHPSLPGHFPGNPIVPGVVLLDEALGLIATRHAGTPASIRVKFTTVVRAGDVIEVVASGLPSSAVNFHGLRDGRSVMTGSLRLEPPG